MRKLFLGMAALALLLTSCNKENDVNSKDRTAMTISLVASTQGGARATVDPGQGAENNITSMEVLVFSKASGALEKRQSLMALTGTITDLTIGVKKVVVITNASSTLKTQLAAVQTYADLNDASKVNMDLISQLNADGTMNSTVGLTMRGEKEATLAGGGAPNNVAVPVSRVVAKVKLGTITVTADPGYDANKLVLSKVHIEKARNKSLLGFADYLMPASGFAYMGGVVVPGTTVSSLQEARLSGPAATGANSTYFYVLPNDNATGNCTLMTIEGTYDGKIQYYVFRINDKVVTGQEATTGKYLMANHSYTVNVTLKRLGDGSDNPETPSDPATMIVTVTPENWVLVPVQNVAW